MYQKVILVTLDLYFIQGQLIILIPTDDIVMKSDSGKFKDLLNIVELCVITQLVAKVKVPQILQQVGPYLIILLARCAVQTIQFDARYFALEILDLDVVLTAQHKLEQPQLLDAEPKG